MPPRTKNPTKKRKQDQPTTSSHPQVCSDDQIERWMNRAPHSLKRYEDIQKKKLHTGPFYNLLKFPMYDLDELCETAGLETLIPFQTNDIKIDQLAVFLFYSNLDSTAVWNTENEENWLWSSVYGNTIRLTPGLIGRTLGCSDTGEDLYNIPDMRFKPRDSVTHQIWEDNMPKFASKYLRPKARLLTRMIINTIIPQIR